MRDQHMKRVSRLICAGFGMAAVCASTSVGHAQNVISAYVTFYGFDDNDDGNPSHLGTGIISHATVHGAASEDIGTYEHPGTLATDRGFIEPGTKVYVPALQRYYVMEDTCVECSQDWLQSKPHVDLYVSGTGPELASCEERLTMVRTKIIIDPTSDLPVKPGSACNSNKIPTI
jgi:hypothetical protein